MVIARILIIALALSASSAQAADELMGAWQRGDGIARVKVAPCGKVICMTNIYIRPDVTDEKVGERIEFDVKSSGADLAGTVLDPKTGKSYSATIVVDGDRMSTRGCILGGVICKSTEWTRLR
ncbi:DUF2147 domain-containing protein [Tardiphaga sp. vice352]|uniref:DUF2147 domain-containing protein n=1 Tax=unclassified Tardiphaga TaxID=2631404 RepID=UPI001161D251|nr:MULTISPECIES: DUF2147 domain-containing protein [unclassified Tardiphaga]QDM15990.1 DUF2147 domain-containing protein [Tardiphaga sp. vice278]QDM21089.1 DUF2147 domain-containing protein [Tardiphaga sp. vice154]QDM26186.1 DUF2147 domain-containing protein [Tardiphaga sp. vice304]QDM31333.1 DUF2147 domain-containing protein [Tardiphaga sp. vice352]